MVWLNSLHDEPKRGLIETVMEYLLRSIRISGVTMTEVASLRGENSERSAVGLALPRFFIVFFIDGAVLTD